MRVLPLMLGAGLFAGSALAQVHNPPNIRVPSVEENEARAQERLKEGQRLMAEDEFAPAAAAFQEAIALEPSLFMAHYGLGRARMATREYESALRAFEEARRAFGSRAERGEAARVRNETARQDRMRRLREAIRTPPQTGSATEARWRQEWEAELAMLEATQERGEGGAQPPAALSLALGSAYFRTGHLPEAEREYRAALAAEPKLGEAHVNLAVVCLMTGRAREAKKELEAARKAGSRVPPGLEKDVEVALVAGKAP